MLKLSFIIPLYNTERFILECLESLYKQELDESEFEVIVVNDGSTDSSAALVSAFTVSKTNCRILNRKNQGVSVARNQGLEVATGAYVMFVDADDFLLPATIGALLQKAVDYNLDLIRGECMEVDSKGVNSTSGYADKLRNLRQPFSGQLLDGVTFCNHIFQGLFYSVLFLFRREFLMDTGLRYPKGIRMCEDVYFLIQVSLQATCCMYLNTVMYVVRQNPYSAVATMDKAKLLDYLWVLDQLSRMGFDKIKKVTDTLILKGVCMILSWADLLPASERETVVEALRAPAFSRLSLSDSMRFKVQGLIYNLFSSRGFLFFKHLSDLFRFRRK